MHLIQHSEDDGIKCLVCKQMFTQRSELKIHMRNHSSAATEAALNLTKSAATSPHKIQNINTSAKSNLKRKLGFTIDEIMQR